MRPLDHGADLVIHSLTKYYNGHGDAMGGVVIGDRELVEETRTGAMWHAGGAISPFNAWLIMRGSTTLPLRLQRQCETARAVAEFLAADPRVAHVVYPGLRDHAQHDAAVEQLTGGFGGVVSFALPGSTRTGCGSSTTCASSPPRSRSVTTRRSSPTSSIPKAPLLRSPSRSGSAA